MTAQYTGTWWHDCAISDDDSWFDDDNESEEQDWDTIRKDESLRREYDE